MLSLNQVSLHIIAISAFVEYKRLISSAFLLTKRDRQGGSILSVPKSNVPALKHLLAL